LWVMDKLYDPSPLSYQRHSSQGDKCACSKTSMGYKTIDINSA